MNKLCKRTAVLPSALGLSLAFSTAVAQTYSAETPEAVLTPDLVETQRLGVLRFFDGMPDEDTVHKAYDNLDFMRGVKAGMKVYLLSEAEEPPEETFVNFSGLQMNTIHANDVTYFDELNAIVQNEPADAFDPEIAGLFASIGIRKDVPFEPDERMQGILADAAAVGNATARALLFRPRDRDQLYYYPDRQWYTAFAGGSHEFMGNGVRGLDDRTMFHYAATGITPAMSSPEVGTGSVYAFTAHDASGAYLDGSRTYKVTLPGPVPMNNFWSFVAYSTQHRSMLETDQRLAGLDSTLPGVTPNNDGSYTIWFGPEAPDGQEDHWVQTMPGKGFAVILRLYGPLEPWFDKTWKPGDLEPVK